MAPSPAPHEDTSHEVFLGLMGELPDGSQCLQDATGTHLTGLFWSVWVIATYGDDTDEIEDHDFPLAAYAAADSMADDLVAKYGAELTILIPRGFDVEARQWLGSD